MAVIKEPGREKNNIQGWNNDQTGTAAKDGQYCDKAASQTNRLDWSKLKRGGLLQYQSHSADGS